ncbi:hypothetical protein [Streptomyces anulatus]|uniref:hypothetical protein n=1 Tax=Streptomyces anulatus TaxID=1892 RepID=UPI001F2D766E|nr:hypothetical protein [Streptomyces anulatus]
MALCAALGAVLGAAVWLWPQGDSEAEEEAQTCWGVLAELDIHSSGSIGACGDALETAMTGKPAGSEPSDAAPVRLTEKQSQAFEHVVNAYGERDVNARSMPSGIRRNLAQAITYYRNDVYQIVHGQVDYSDPNFSTEPNGIDIDAMIMLGFLEGVAGDEVAFRMVRESMFSLIVQQVKDLDQGDFAGKPSGEIDDAYGVARDSGEGVGTLRWVRSKALERQYEGSGGKLKKALASEDFSAYGFSWLEQLIRNHASSLAVPETVESKRRLEGILSEAEDSYQRGLGGTPGYTEGGG